MEVAGLTVDPVNNAPIVLLRELAGDRVLPIWIGVIEASAIAFEMEQIQLSRPMTHDLLKTAVESLGAVVERVEVVALRDNTYFALVILNQDGKVIQIDARPSDAIALALRTKAPIHCEAAVIEQAHIRDQPGEATDETVAEETPAHEPPAPAPEVSEAAEEAVDEGPQPIMGAESRSLEDVLENLSPEAFGKYKM